MLHPTGVFFQLLHELDGFKRLPDEGVFLNIEDNLAWFNSRQQILDNPSFYVSWHPWDGSWNQGKFKTWRQGKLRMAYTQLPEAVQAMGENPTTGVHLRPSRRTRLSLSR